MTNVSGKGVQAVSPSLVCDRGRVLLVLKSIPTIRFTLQGTSIHVKADKAPEPPRRRRKWTRKVSANCVAC